MKFIFSLSILLIQSTVIFGAHSEIETKLLDLVEENYQDQIQFTKTITQINSGTKNSVGVHQVGEIVAKEFEKIGFQSEWFDSHLFLTKKGTKGKKILLIGHLDTVYEGPGEVIEEDGKIYGPGIYDMKGGIGVILFALKTLSQYDLLTNSHITIALMGDEEDPASPFSESRKELVVAAKTHDIALGFEFNRSLNKIVTKRRGVMDWKLNVQTNSGHASRIFSEEMGEGAILTAAKILSEWRETLKGLPHLTFNPGIIVGGAEIGPHKAKGKTNIIASNVEVRGDLRYHSKEYMDFAIELMREIAESNGATLELDQDYYPPMEESAGALVLLTTLSTIHQKMGLEEISSYELLERGAADTNFVAHLLPTIDGLGAIGGHAHCKGKEYFSIEGTKLATQRLALFLDCFLKNPR